MCFLESGKSGKRIIAVYDIFSITHNVEKRNVNMPKKQQNEKTKTNERKSLKISAIRIKMLIERCLNVLKMKKRIVKRKK